MTDIYCRDTAAAIDALNNLVDDLDGVILSDYVDAIRKLLEEADGLVQHCEDLTGDVESLEQQVSDLEDDIENLECEKANGDW